MSRPYIPAELRRQVIEDAGDWCGYCLSDEVLMGVSLTFEHILPLARGGPTDRENLWRACRRCNEGKNARTHIEDPDTGGLIPLYDPRQQTWNDHFKWVEDYTKIIGKTPIGNVTVDALRLNRPLLVKARKRWRLMGWLPTSEEVSNSTLD